MIRRRRVYPWITRPCKYFACSKLRPQALDYHCCCVTLAASFLCIFFSSALLCSIFFPSLFICLATNLMSASLLSLPLSVSLSLHNRSFRPSVSSISSSPLPPSWCSHWHLRRPVLCQTAIPQIEISRVLKSLRQIYYLNGREWRGARGGLVHDFGSGWRFDSLILESFPQ